MWLERPEIKKLNHNEKVIQKKYEECVKSAKLCTQLVDGKLYRCAVHAHATLQQQVPLFEEEIINLDIDSVEKIRNFITREKFLKVCDYCSWNESKFVKPAQQLKE